MEKSLPRISLSADDVSLQTGSDNAESFGDFSEMEESSSESAWGDNDNIEPRDKVHQAAHIASEVTKHTWIVTKLAFLLLSYMGVGWRWFERFVRLGLFIVLLLPAFLKVLYRWCTSENLVRNITYGRHSRNVLDIYLPTSNAENCPVIVFFSGGAWIIGYKAWGSLMGFVLAELGVMFITPDYRNFPQGRVTEMLEDVNRSMKWVIKNCAKYGGDNDNIYLVGQSAGAHLAALALITEAERERRIVKKHQRKGEPDLWNGYVGDFRENETPATWNIRHIRGFIGISGVYDVAGFADYLHSRGLYRSVLSSIFRHDLSYYSPTRRVGTVTFDPRLDTPISSFMPPITLLHGTADQSIPSRSTTDFANALSRAGIVAHVKYYQGKSHTDPIIEDPIGGGYDQLVMDIFSIIMCGGDLCSNNPCNSPAMARRHHHFPKASESQSRCRVTAAENKRMRQKLQIEDENMPKRRGSPHLPDRPCRNVDARDFGFIPFPPMAPLFNIRQARAINPF